MKIISRNINWIRAVIQKWFFDFIKNENPDIICLQETKAFETQIPTELRFHLSDYDYIWHKWTRPWYAGTTIFFKKNIQIKEEKSKKNVISGPRSFPARVCGKMPGSDRPLLLTQWGFPCKLCAQVRNYKIFSISEVAEWSI